MILKIKISGKVIYWKGPAPFYFLPIPETESADIKGISHLVTYGWGVIPSKVKIGDTEFKTALFPKDGKYLIPLKQSLRKEEFIDTDDKLEAEVEISF